ncbi:MAG TPA: T9SS type A sorting domain-containing protein [Saprospiraceae bacterium]|nr:T9SS type A sorting domain-containing protein [Saprospiraceae bacterium]
MHKIYVLFCIFLMSRLLPAQPQQWMNYSNDGTISNITADNKFVWISTDGGIVRIDRETGVRQIYQPWNSGLRGSTVNAVDPAKDGSWWISAGMGGLFKFDGDQHWEQFNPINTGDTLIDVRNLMVTTEGKLWFISYANNNCSGCTKLFHYNGVQFSEHSAPLEAVLGNNGIRKLCFDQSERLWVNSGTKIVRYDGINVYETIVPLLSSEYINQIGFDQNNTLWVSTYQSQSGNLKYRLRYLTGNTWAELSEAEFGGEIFQVFDMFQDSQGNFYINFYSEASFAKFDGSSWEYIKVATLPNSPHIPDAMLKSVDASGHLWFYQYNNSGAPTIYEFDGQNWNSYNSHIFPLTSNYISDVAFDCDRNTWFGGDILTRFDGLSWKEFTLADIGLNSSYMSIWSLNYDTAHCALWISYNTNDDDPVAFSKYDGQTFTHYNTPDGYGAFETVVSSNGTVWVASSSSGLGQFDGNVWTWYNEQNSPVSDFLWSVTLDQSQNVWFAGDWPTIIGKYNGVTWTIFNEANSPVDGLSNWVYIDHSGMVWTSNATGLLRFNGTQWQHFAVPGTGQSGIYRMTQDQYHHFWISNRTGLLEWDGSTFKVFHLKDYPLASLFAGRVNIDLYGNKWIANNNYGVTVYNENGLSNQIINPEAGVKGKVYFDTNQNGQEEPGGSEPGIPGEKVLLQPENMTIFTNMDGEFTLYPSPGAYELQYTGNESYTPTTQQNLPLLMGTSEQIGFNYGAWQENPEDSISLDLTVGFLRCNAPSNTWINIVNYGLLPAEGEITMKFDTALTFISADPAPVSVQNGLITWYYNNLAFLETRIFNAIFQVPGVTSVGQFFSFHAEATVESNGTISAADKDDERAEVRCSLDPNDKAVASLGPSSGQYVLRDQALDFTVRFQNSGNDTAFTVVILDTLDASLDFTTLELIASSHLVRTTLSSDGVLKFAFDQINLLWESIDYAGSQGFVKYRIAPKPGLPDPTLVRNTAHIYFDFNPAIVTNTTESILVETLPSIGTEEVHEEPTPISKLFPNPSFGVFTFEWISPDTPENWNLTIIDALGRIHFRSNFQQRSVNIKGLDSGFYIIVTENKGRITTHKLVVQKNR